MTEAKDKAGVFQVVCPGCGTLLWVDPATREILKTEKGQKKKGSLDELLVKEKKRQQEFDRKFEATFELHHQKHSQAEEKFKKAMEKAEKGEDEQES
jgi:hypothetical protein